MSDKSCREDTGADLARSAWWNLVAELTMGAAGEPRAAASDLCISVPDTWAGLCRALVSSP